MARTTSHTGWGDKLPTPRCGEPAATAVPARTIAVPAAASIHNLLLEICMEGDPSDLKGSGQPNRGLVDDVVRDQQARRPGRGPHDGGPALLQRLVLDVVVAEAPVHLDPDPAAGDD